MKKQLTQVIMVLIAVSTTFTTCTQKLTNGIADINGTSIYFESAGEGTPIIFLHRFACDNRNWSKQIDFFLKIIM